MQDILELAGVSRAAAVVDRLRGAQPADIVQQLNELDAAEAAEIVARLPLEKAADVFDHPDLAEPQTILAALRPAVAAEILDAMAADRLADLFRDMEEPPRERLLALLTREARAIIDALLVHPEGTAGSMMTTEFVSVPATWSVAETLRHIREVEGARETVYAIYVLDPITRRLQAAVSLRRLISGDPDALVGSVARFDQPVTVLPQADREEVARLISKYDLLAIPVVDEKNHVLGIVTVDDIIDTMIEVTTEDVHKFGGMEALDEPYTRIGFAEMLRKRAGWLAILFLSEMLTASAMQHFEDELEKAVVLTLFIPLIMSSGGNSGSQATSLIIRALALGELKLSDWWRVALREIPTGLALGGFLGVIGVARIAVWQEAGIFDYGPHWMLVALTVGLALVAIVTFGSLAGSMLPFALKRLGFDPASASAPFVATLVDVSGLVIYFSVALVVLSGTLL
ncbi:magnesium transporter MgtE [Aureimonas endophytica]|uniref:Magnesium transporter MgtE n=1 Tax=Aureimonas endophytica TaxID=2027858 RepID=A0A917E8M8_9HYPH|nr:magnesium transporter [Aureimonas endophytica]GGE10089.1 magnesium transporter MgtE [Aureimonas endophytica]